MKLVYSLGVLLASVVTLAAQSYPLTDTSWSNPTFVKQFTAGYAVLTKAEPEISSSEAELFKSVTPLIEQGDHAGAITAIRGAMNEESSAALNFTIANLYLQQQRAKEAIREYKAAIKKFPAFRRAYKNLGLAYVQASDFTNGRKMLIEAIELGDSSGLSFGLLGYSYLNEGKAKSALDAYRMASLLQPENDDWKTGEGVASMKTGQYREAISIFKELISENQDNGAFYVSVANAHLSLGEETEAARMLELVRQIGLADVDAKLLLGDLYVNLNLPQLALEVYRSTLPVAKGFDEKRYIRFVRALLQRAAYEEAEEIITSFLDSDPETLSASLELAMLNFQSQIAMAQGKRDEAMAILEKIVDRDPLNGEALISLGRSYFDIGDIDQSIFFFERAQKLPDSQIDALVQMARLYVSKQDFKRAVELLEEAQSLRPQRNVANYLDAVRSVYRTTR